MIATLYYLHVLTPLHIGAGQGSGVIDLPIAREKATHLPYVPGTSVKGVLREEMRPESHDSGEEQQWEALFGPARIKDDKGFAGALAMGDAHLLCLPVRSLAGTFAWATCPFILQRFVREALAAGLTCPDVPSNKDDSSALVCPQSQLVSNDALILEDLELSADDGPDSGAAPWADTLAQHCFPDNKSWQSLFKDRFTILPDAAFDFLAETATEIRPRVRIDKDTRTVEKGALWYEENLPAETLLYGLLGADRARNSDITDADMLKAVKTGTQRLQLGGKASVGRGVVHFIKHGE